MSDLESLRRSAQALTAAWRKTISLTAFLDQVEAAVARRADGEVQPRRPFWDRWFRASAR